MPRAKVAQLRQISVRPASLDAPIGDDDATEFSELVGDDNAATPFEMLRDKTLRQDIVEVLHELEPREAEILTLRFGLDGNRPKTLEDVGRKFRVTRERVRQIQNIALHKLRRLMEKQDKPSPVGRN
jgi:RNA polymerase primary sigma factor